jgi:two-component system LytT family response regulator/two-component system response regulator AlgR
MTGEPLRVAVAEDEPMNRKRLVRLLREAGCEVVATFEDGDAVLRWAQAGPEVDALFLDIRMPGPSGLEVLRALELPPPVVFVTAHPEHAVAAFEDAAADYLLKPVAQPRLDKCLARIRERRAAAPRGAPGPKASRYPVKAGDGLVFLDLARTTHFEVVDEVVWAHAQGRFQTLWKALAEVEAAFPAAGLLRAHRHLLVRPETILGIKPIWGGRLTLTLPGGVELESSRGATARIKSRLGLA